MTATKSHPIVFDSSCWIELLTKGPLFKSCEKEFKSASAVLVPTIIIYEVYKKISSSTSEDQALSVVALMSQHKVLDLTRDISLAAADLSLSRKLPMADSLVLAHAQYENAVLVTLDNDFANIPNAKVLR